jgi:putative FmdB family regulatory protein
MLLSDMPIYEYSCEKCGRTIEVIQKMSDPELKKHEGCGGKLTKLISASAFQFKGSGWYVTDYARKSEGGDSSGKETQESANKKEAESKEKKPAATTSTDSAKTSTSKPPESKPAKSSDKKE